MRYLKRLDDGLARGEAAIAAVVLLAMILVAALQALLRNLTNFDLAWANAALEQMSSADSFLQKCTLWLAFLGASLATHDERHIAIDVLQKVVPPRMRHLMRALVALFAAVTSFYLARVFWLAVLNNAVDRPLEYEVLVASGAAHVCDAGAAALSDAGLDRPGLFCGVRWILGKVGAPVETPGAASQLIVPAMFLVIAVRLVGKAIGAFMTTAQSHGGAGAGAGTTEREGEG